MADVAREAFVSQNYDLAVQIYDRLLMEQQSPDQELYLGKADCLARSGNLNDAFEYYSRAFRMGQVSPDRLTHLVTGVIEMVSKKEGLSVSDYNDEPLDVFSCFICHGLLYEPATIPCGHTFCKLCVQKHKCRTCKICGAYHGGLVLTTLKVNVILSNVIEKCFQKESQACKLKVEGNHLISEDKFPEATEKYTEALKLVPTDHLLLSNRSHAYMSLGNYQEAFEDGERACQLRPEWPKGHYRKGSALLSMCRYEEALVTFMQCLVLDPTDLSAKKQLAKVLQCLLSPLPPENMKHSELQHHSLARSMFPPLPLAPPITQSSVNFLRSAIHQSFSNCGEADVLDRGLQEEEDLSNSSGSTSDDQTQSSSSASRESEDPVERKSDFKALLKYANSETDRLKELSPSPRTKSSTRSVCSKLHLSSEVIAMGKRKRSDFSPLSSPIRTEFKFSKTEVEPRKPRELDPVLVDKIDFECSLCFRLYYEPVTTPCGHMFCRHCLNRCLDHNNKCPLCKYSLVEYLAERRNAVTEVMQKIIETSLADELKERKKIHEAELEEMSSYLNNDKVSDIPVFVCTLAYPTVPCPLHIFEPRYRLMVRQCMETGTRQFGMCMPGGPHGFVDYGCMLEIRDVQFFPDGRSVVDAVGGRRFKVLDRGMRDGYHIAKVEFLKDNAIEGEEEIAQFRSLHDEIYGEARTWFDGLRGVIKNRIMSHFGTMPGVEENPETTTHGPQWTWWLLAVLPLDTRAQLTIMAMPGPKERLLALRRVLNYVSRQNNS